MQDDREAQAHARQAECANCYPTSAQSDGRSDHGLPIGATSRFGNKGKSPLLRWTQEPIVPGSPKGCLSEGHLNIEHQSGRRPSLLLPAVRKQGRGRRVRTCRKPTDVTKEHDYTGV